jgi:hypothetical protein
VEVDGESRKKQPLEKHFILFPQPVQSVWHPEYADCTGAAQKKTAGEIASRPRGSFYVLPVSTTTTAVSATTEAAATAAVEATASTHAAAVKATGATTAYRVGNTATCERMSTAGIAGSAASKAVTGACIADSATVAYTTTISNSAVSTAAVVSTATTIVSTATPVPAIPRASADKEATDEPARAVVAIRRTGVRIVVVIPPRTDRSGIPIAVIPVPRTDSDTYTDLRIGRGSKQ